MLLWTGYLIGLATGRWHIGRVRDERDALQARWLFGGMSVVLGAVFLALSEAGPVTKAAAASLIISGLAVIRTARALAPTDPTNRVSNAELDAAARSFVFDSRPPARGEIDIFAKRGWVIFIGLAALGFAALLIGVAVGTAFSGRWEILVFLAAFVAFFLGFLIIPSVWFVQRAIRGVPLLRIDREGIVMGRDRSHDPAVTWSETTSIEVRMISSSGYSDRLILVHTVDRAWVRRYPWYWRAGLWLSRVMYGAPFSISTTMLSVSIEEILARIRAHKPSLIESLERH